MTQNTVTKSKVSIAEAFDSLMREPLPLRITAYDGSAAGPETTARSVGGAEPRVTVARSVVHA